MHSLAWDNPEEERMTFQAIAKSTPGQVIDLPTLPDHIIIDVKPQAGTKWPKHLNLALDSNFIHIPIGLMSQCDKKAKVVTQESVTYYDHAVDSAFAITGWKCQGGTFEYIIALLEHSPGTPALTIEKLYVMFTRVKEANHFRCLPLSPTYDKQTLFYLQLKILATKWRMDIDKHGYWRPWTSTSPALSQPKFSKASAEKQRSK
jgi:hypothetical protein